ncbi:MAG: glucosidase [Nannocystaceae bacterium]|nr:glucosidase [Nannocystaceae bacterium]
MTSPPPDPRAGSDRLWGCAEQARLDAEREHHERWKRWGPYLSERQWGTVREDYSPWGNAWESFPHDHARSRAYRWGEDGIGGWSDDRQLLCFSLALWNERDPILKERLFGLTNAEGNHGEDVKEAYWYVDALPSHAWAAMLYRYPQAEFPYAELVARNQSRGRDQPEYELVDTGVFDGQRFFDVFIEYVQVTPGDTILRVRAINRGPVAAPLLLLPQACLRNRWSWNRGVPRPRMTPIDPGTVRVDDAKLGRCYLHHEAAATALFCENDTNVRRMFGNHGAGPFKDAFHEAIVDGRAEALAQPGHGGTKFGALRRFEVAPGEEVRTYLRCSPEAQSLPFADVDGLFALRRGEADAFYHRLQADMSDADARAVQRQALAGMIWSKQFYHYDVRQWLDGDPDQPPPPSERRGGRNRTWRHLNNADIISMPDTWEYPWYASWDLAFHCLPLALIDPEFAKSQLVLLTREWYMHPSGQLPAYEWAFDDVNPPVHAWAAWRVFKIDQKRTGGDGDLAFLEGVFHKLMLNFTWWVNRKDSEGRNIFQGGFLGLDNIGCFDRSKPLPTGGFVNQADGTAWMAMYSLNLMRIALELAQHNPVYEDIATKFFEHFLHIAEAMWQPHEDGPGLWHEGDDFYYDVLSLPSGERFPLRVRSLVGLIPMCAVEVLEPTLLQRLPGFAERLNWVLDHRPELAKLVSRWHEPGLGERRLLSLLRGSRLKRLLRRMLDPAEFLSDFGIRSLSAAHRDQPFRLEVAGQQLEVDYQPGESTTALFGGNSNWRGPIWLPINFLLIEALQKFHHYYGDDFRVECPTGSGQRASLDGIADMLARRVASLVLRGADGRRPALGDDPRVQDDPHTRGLALFHEYFDGDSGKGLGASHQTGWTGLVAKLLQPRR